MFALMPWETLIPEMISKKEVSEGRIAEIWGSACREITVTVTNDEYTRRMPHKLVEEFLNEPVGEGWDELHCVPRFAGGDRENECCTGRRGGLMVCYVPDLEQSVSRRCGQPVTRLSFGEIRLGGSYGQDSLFG